MLPPLDTPAGKSKLVFEEKDFNVGSGSDHRLVSLEVPFSNAVKNQGGMLFAHVLIGKAGSVLDPNAPGFQTSNAYRFIKPLIKYMPKKKVVKTKHLLGGKDEDKEEQVEEVAAGGDKLTAPYWHSNITMQVIQNSGIINYRQLPPPLRQYVVLDPTSARDASGANGWYYPIAYVNEFWHLKDQYIELNSTVS